MTAIGPIILFLMIIGALATIKKLNKQRRERMMSKSDSGSLERLEKLRLARAFAEKKSHISYKEITEWAEGKLDGDFLDRKLAGEWRLHVDACTSCQEIIEYFRAERKKKAMNELTKELQN